MKKVNNFEKSGNSLKKVNNFGKGQQLFQNKVNSFIKSFKKDESLQKRS